MPKRHILGWQILLPYDSHCLLDWLFQSDAQLAANRPLLPSSEWNPIKPSTIHYVRLFCRVTKQSHLRSDQGPISCPCPLQHLVSGTPASWLQDFLWSSTSLPSLTSYFCRAMFLNYFTLLSKKKKITTNLDLSKRNFIQKDYHNQERMASQ